MTGTCWIPGTSPSQTGFDRKCYAVPPTVSPSILSVGWPTPHRHALAVVAAGAHAGVELEVVADHADLLQHVRPVADQGRALDRRPDLAVLDQVGLGGARLGSERYGFSSSFVSGCGLTMPIAHSEAD